MLTMPFAIPSTSLLLMAAWPIYAVTLFVVLGYWMLWRSA